MRTGKEYTEFVHKFSRKIVQMAAEEGLTIRELYKSLDMIRKMAE